jgi:hypothetical protein
VFVSSVLRRRRKWQEAKQNIIRVYDEELHDLYSPLYIIRMMKSGKIFVLVRSAGHIARMGTIISAVEKLQGKKTFGNPGRRADDNIKLDLKEIGCEDVD